MKDRKHAIVTPVHKTGSKSDPSNFRPISVLPIFSKILERAVHRTAFYRNTLRLLLLSNPAFAHCTLRPHATHTLQTLCWKTLTKDY